VVSVQDFRVGYQKSLDLNIYIIIYIWRFPEIGVPPVIIHL
jgi:hypothetical protein